MVLTTRGPGRDAIRHVRGSWGEESTRSELAAAKRRRLIWGWVDSIDTAGGDIDHLVVTRRGGLVAIDSKFRTQVGTGHPAEMARAAQRARLRAEGVTRSVLEAPERGRRRARTTSTVVTPVVVLWGSAAAGLPEGGAVVDGVRFVTGRGLRSWLRTLDAQPVDRAVARDLIARLEGFRARAFAPTTS